MASRRRGRARLESPSDALSIEGGLLGPTGSERWLNSRPPRRSRPTTGFLRGLYLRDEIARSWRIAEACFREMEAGRASGGDARALVERFLEAFFATHCVSRP